ncbi:MAG: hypothetical protein P9X24_19320 [Candidatus Hatepunaea meridiana]|nr:hypothetical protein [Candidatus Hatepunaea meridiana]
MNQKITIKTGHPEFDNLYPMVKSFLEKDALDIVIDGKNIRGYRSPDAKSIWIRDYSDMLRGVKYFENDLKSAIDHFAETQADNGRIFDYFTTFPEKLPSERENWTKYVRVPVEADVEYRFVKAAFLAWQATGDDEWILKLLPKMEKALQYILNHPWRWDKKLGLVKRAYTIDTWDFAYTAGRHDWLQFQINDDTFWGIMHGDNSGYYEAFRIMALLYDYFVRSTEAEMWSKRADDIKTAMNRICWNGSFYTHFVKLTPVEIPGVDEAAQLSLSNPMNINRGVATSEMAVSIIEEYLKRGKETDAFAEWFSIDPPFPDGIFGDDKLIGGAYINGGIMPLVGGELAKAAFDNGFEKYGVDILRRYYKMISEKGETYLWYSPDGSAASVETSTSPEAEPTDGWGSSAMLYALIEGLAGIEDKFKQFKKVKLSPRWYAAGIDRAEVRVGYEASGVSFGYLYLVKDDCILLEVEGNDCEVWFHTLTPDGFEAKGVEVDGKDVDFKNVKVGESWYVDFNTILKNDAQVRIETSKKS